MFFALCVIFAAPTFVGVLASLPIWILFLLAWVVYFYEKKASTEKYNYAKLSCGLHTMGHVVATLMVWWIVIGTVL